MRGLRAAADVMLPRVCIVCGTRLNSYERHLCLYCQAEMPLTYFWERSHNSMADRFNGLIEEGLESYVTGGQLERYVYGTALFFYDGDGSFRRIPQQLKYHGNIRLGQEFGRMLGRRIAESGHFSDVDAVMPVPLHWTRKWKRGYNQAEVIAREVAGIIDAALVTDILKRGRRTRTQTKVDPAMKSENVRGAFCVDRSKAQELNCRHILLVDDVFTSGSTLFECFRALRSVFPPSVRISVATLGYVGGA